MAAPLCIRIVPQELGKGSGKRSGERSGKRSCIGVLLAAAVLLSGCASQPPVVVPPEVRLESVALHKLGLSGQTFLLGFSVSNPNAFSLPIRNIRYELRLDDKQFARGETRKGFVVAARSDAEFAISVELDLLESAQSFNTLREGGFQRTLRYDLEGSLGIDLPLVKPVPFSRSGSISLGAGR